MFNAVFLTQSSSGEPSLPVMIVVIILCLSLPYIIRRKTGKSLNEWLSSMTLISWLTRKKEKESGVKKVPTEEENRHAAQVKKQEEKALMLQQQNAGRNDWMYFIKDVLDFTRRNHLFVLVPGHVRSGKGTTEYTMIVVTRSRVIGVVGEPGGGTIHCGGENGSWSRRENGAAASMENPCRLAMENLPLLKDALTRVGVDPNLCETAVVVTAKTARIEGNRPANVMKAEAFLKSISKSEDLTDGNLDPKAIGKALHKLGK